MRLYMAHTADYWAAIVAGSHAEARSLCKQDDVTVLSCREAVGQDVRGQFRAGARGAGVSETGSEAEGSG